MRPETQFGRSMVEMLGVLAIIGVLSVGGLAGYTTAMKKYKLNKQSEQIQNIIMAFFAKLPNADSRPDGGNVVSAFVDAGIVPKEDFMSDGGGAVRMAYNGQPMVILRYEQPTGNLICSGGFDCHEMGVGGFLMHGADEDLCIHMATNPPWPITINAAGGNKLDFWRNGTLPLDPNPSMSDIIATCKGFDEAYLHITF